MRTRSSLHVVAVTALALLALSTTGARAQTATIEGTITEPDGTTPVPGATVAVSNPLGGLPLETGVANASGDYSITVNMDAATMDLIVEAASEDFAPARHDWTDPLPCFFNCGPGGELSVTAGPTPITGIDISLNSGGRIAGTVTASDTSAGLANATVELISASNRRGYSSQFTAVTDVSGDYTSPLAMPPGHYHVLAEPAVDLANYPNYLDDYVAEAWNDRSCEFGRCPIANTGTVTIVTGPATPGIDFALAPGAAISGNLEPDGVERFVYLYDGAGRMLDYNFFQGDSAAETAWSFNGLAGGSYYVQLGPFTGQSPYLRILHNGLLCPWSGCERARGVPITIPPGSSLGLATITLDQGGQINGSIVDAATGSAPAGVPTNARLGNYDIINASGTVVGGGIITESGGDIVMETSSAVPAGDYYVRTYSEFFGDGIGFVSVGGSEAIDGYADAMYPEVPCAGIDCDLGAASTVSVTSGNVTSITIEISPGSTISGRVVDASGGAPIENAIVRLVDASGNILANNYTDENGDYEFGGFPAGDYYVRTSMSGHLGPGVGATQNAYFDKVYGAASDCSELLCDPTDGTQIELDGSADATLTDIEVNSGPIISGQILFALTGYVIPRGQVEVYNDSGELVGSYKLDFFDATYRTTALAPGDYTLVPVVSPAFGDVSTSGGSGVATTRQRGSGSDNALVVTVGTESVSADLRVVDRALDAIFGDDFGNNQ